MPRYKAIVAYDGTDYYGWQAQPNKPTIAGTLQDTFARVFETPITIAGVSRTDAGVHARAQVASCVTTLDLDPHKLRFAWQNRLPHDIILRSVARVTDDFNLYDDVIQKTYKYHIFTRRSLPFTQRYGWYVRKSCDAQKLDETLQQFVGTHDFRPFCAVDDEPVDTVRRIDSIDLIFNKRLNRYTIVVKGPSFLRYMIRRIVGAAVTIASTPSASPEYIETILKHTQLNHNLMQAPAHGLVLHNVRYRS